MSKHMGKYCPLIKKDCIEHKCAFFTLVSGQDPQTGAPLDKFACAISLIPLLQIEQARQIKGNSSAIEDFRNETIKRTEITNQLLFNGISSNVQNVRVIPEKPTPHILP